MWLSCQSDVLRAWAVALAVPLCAGTVSLCKGSCFLRLEVRARKGFKGSKYKYICTLTLNAKKTTRM